MEIAPRISVDEKIRFGKPVISGTRVPVDLIIGKLAGGMTYEEVIAEYKITFFLLFLLIKLFFLKEKFGYTGGYTVCSQLCSRNFS